MGVCGPSAASSVCPTVSLPPALCVCLCVVSVCGLPAARSHTSQPACCLAACSPLDTGPVAVLPALYQVWGHCCSPRHSVRVSVCGCVALPASQPSTHKWTLIQFYPLSTGCSSNGGPHLSVRCLGDNVPCSKTPAAVC